MCSTLSLAHISALSLGSRRSGGVAAAGVPLAAPEPGVAAVAAMAGAGVPMPPAAGVDGVRLLRAGDADVDGGGSRMKRRCGFSRAGSSAAAGDAAAPAPLRPLSADGGG